MKITYSPDVDALTIVLRAGNFVHTEELEEGVLVDYDDHESILAIEILDASERVDVPDGVDFSILKGAKAEAITAA